MGRSVMISVKPRFCDLIAREKKKIEVRKTRPKTEIPFKCYIYCTRAKRSEKLYSNGTVIVKDTRKLLDPSVRYPGSKIFQRWNGKVIGEFVCDKIHSVHVPSDIRYCVDFGIWSPLSEKVLNDACLTAEESLDYAGNKEFIFGWHISDIVIYDKPKELSEFYVEDTEAIKDCKNRFRFGQPESVTQNGGWINGGYGCLKDGEPEWCEKCLKKPLVRPPQSWCYAEEGKR